LVLLILLLGQFAVAHGQDTMQIVRQAVQTELAASQNDHTCWLYYEVDTKPGNTEKQWVAETHSGNVRRVMEKLGQPLSQAAQRQTMDRFVHDSKERADQRKAGSHDDEQATEMLKLLPDGFVWTITGERDNETILHFKPKPDFRPPDRESRVIGAMEGEMAVDKTQHRIVSLKGRLIHEVKFFWGLGVLDAGGTFAVERRNTGNSIWQITETHVHIRGNALFFKSITEEEDDLKSQYKSLPANISLEQAEATLLQQGGTSNALRDPGNDSLRAARAGQPAM
jgi:hypothetical protein